MQRIIGEPWIKSEVFERINRALVDLDTEFHKEVPIKNKKTFLVCLFLSKENLIV